MTQSFRIPKLYRIPVEYKVFGYVYVEGESLKDALEKAHENIDDLPLPDNPEYIDDTFEISNDMNWIRDVNR